MIKTNFLSILGTNGSGKTTITANLGLALNRLGFDVLIVDDNDFPALCHHFNIIFPEKTINDFEEGKISLEEALYFHPSGLKLLFSDPSRKRKQLDYAKLENLAQIVLIDGQKFKNNIVVVNRNLPSVLNSIQNLIDKNTIGIMTNDINSHTIDEESIKVLTNRPLLLSIKKQKDQNSALKKGIPLFEINPDSELSKNLLTTAAILIGKKYEVVLEHNE